MKKLFRLLFTALIFCSCEHSIYAPCETIVDKYKIPIGFIYEDELESEFIVEEELCFFILSSNDTIMVERADFDGKNIGDCYEKANGNTKIKTGKVFMRGKGKTSN